MLVNELCHGCWLRENVGQGCCRFSTRHKSMSQTPEGATKRTLLGGNTGRMSGPAPFRWLHRPASCASCLACHRRASYQRRNYIQQGVRDEICGTGNRETPKKRRPQQRFSHAAPDGIRVKPSRTQPFKLRTFFIFLLETCLDLRAFPSQRVGGNKKKRE